MSRSQEDRATLQAAQAIKSRERREHLASRPAKVATGGGKLSGEAGSPTARKAIPASWQLSALMSHNWRCARKACRAWFIGSEAVPTEFDHVIPLALGGAHAWENIEPLCPTCHLKKTKTDISRIAKAKRQSKLLQPREPSKHPIRSRGFL